MAVLGLCFCARALSSCGKRGPLFIAVRGPLTIAASLVAKHRLQTRRLSNCGPRAPLLRGIWDLPGPGLEPVSPALAGRFLTTAPPGKPWPQFLFPVTLPPPRAPQTSLSCPDSRPSCRSPHPDGNGLPLLGSGSRRRISLVQENEAAGCKGKQTV